jgi:hypothetical protein
MTPSRITKFSMEQIRYLFVRALIKNVTLSGIKEKMFLQNIMFLRKIFLWEKMYLGNGTIDGNGGCPSTKKYHTTRAVTVLKQASHNKNVQSRTEKSGTMFCRQYKLVYSFYGYY